MGWVALAVVAAATMGLLVWLRLDRRMWGTVGAVLMLGAAGYALQGRPMLAAQPAVGVAPAAADDETLIAIRDQMLGRFTGDGAYLVASDAMTRSGDQRAAVQVVLGGIRAIPESVLLWTGLGNVLAEHDGGQVSPPALFAFQQAARLSPQHPAPPFFLGLAYVRAGNFGAAQPLWRRALALTSKNASYRQEIAVRLALLDRYLAAGGPPQA